MNAAQTLSPPSNPIKVGSITFFVALPLILLVCWVALRTQKITISPASAEKVAEVKRHWMAMKRIERSDFRATRDASWARLNNSLHDAEEKYGAALRSIERRSGVPRDPELQRLVSLEEERKRRDVARDAQAERDLRSSSDAADEVSEAAKDSEFFDRSIAPAVVGEISP